MSKKVPPPPPPAPGKQRITPSSRRSFHQKYVPLMINNNQGAGYQMHQEAQTQPPNSPKEQQSKVAFVKKLSIQTHQDSKASSSSVINVNQQQKQQQQQQQQQGSMQGVIQQLEKVQNQNSKLQVALRQSQMREQAITQKLESQQGEYRGMKENVANLKEQLLRFQAKILKSEEQNNRIQQGLLEQSVVQDQIERLRSQNSQLKEALSGENSQISQGNLELEQQLRQMFQFQQGNQIQNIHPIQDQSMNSRMKKLQRQNKQKDDYIKYLKQKLDEKENQILTPKSSRQRTPQHKSRQNWNILGNNNPELIDFDDDNQEKLEYDQIPRRFDDLSHTQQHHNNMQRLGGSRLINHNNNNNNDEQESKTPPTSHHHHYDLRQQLFNNGSNEFIFPNNIGDSIVMPLDDINSRFQNHQQFDILGNHNIQNRLAIRVHGDGQLEPQSTFGVNNLNEVFQRNDLNQQGHVTPRTNQPERKSRRGSRASTPSKDQADTPTKSSAPLHQQMIHNLANGQTISFSQMPQLQQQQQQQQQPAQAQENSDQDNVHVQLCPNNLFS